MTDNTESQGQGPPDEEGEPQEPIIRDKRRIDPETGMPRESGDSHAASDEASEVPDDASSLVDGSLEDAPAEGDSERPDGDEHPDTALAAERLEEMRRMQAEFVNFRNRTAREREADKARNTSTVVEALLPVLDDIHSAREHGDLKDGPMAAIADKLEQALSKFGVERVGEVGDVFDPNVHEALMHLSAEQANLPEDATEMTIVQVMQPGFKVGDVVVRAARVAVADPN